MMISRVMGSTPSRCSWGREKGEAAKVDRDEGSAASDLGHRSWLTFDAPAHPWAAVLQTACGLPATRTRHRRVRFEAAVAFLGGLATIGASMIPQLAAQ